MNKIILTGRLGKDCETKEFDGRKVNSFRIAVDRYDRKKKENVTDWFSCSYWNEKIGQYLTKGKKVLVVGEFYNRVWVNAEGKEVCDPTVNVQELELIGTPQQETQPQKKDDDMPF